MIRAKKKSIKRALEKERRFAQRQVLLKELWKLNECEEAKTPTRSESCETRTRTTFATKADGQTHVDRKFQNCA